MVLRNTYYRNETTFYSKGSGIRNVYDVSPSVALNNQLTAHIYYDSSISSIFPPQVTKKESIPPIMIPKRKGKNLCVRYRN